MTTKTLAEEYFLLRTNAIQRRRFQNQQLYGDVRYSHDADDPRAELLKDETSSINGVEEQKSDRRNGNFNSPPSYFGQSEALIYQMKRLETKIEQLNSLHKKHLDRPTLDDKNEEEAQIQSFTKDICDSFNACHQQIKSIRRATLHSCTGLESIVAKNVIIYLSNRLQELTVRFRSSQNDYLKKIKSREEKSTVLFEFEDQTEEDPLAKHLDQIWAKDDLAYLEENTRYVKHREKEINQIVQSISDLNTIFKELGSLVTEQGSIIDRIDHNIENTQIKVEEGLMQLKQADQYQKKNRKMHCIVILAVIVLILLFVLIVTKT